MTAFQDMSVRLATALSDQQADGTSITVATQDGKKRSSAQRSADIMAARYWAWSIFKIANKQMFYTEIPLDSPIGSGKAVIEITDLNITTPDEITLKETSLIFNKPVPIIDGDALPIFQVALQSSHAKEMVAGLIADVSQTNQVTQVMNLVILVGAALPQDMTLYTFVLGYYNNPFLQELTADNNTDDMTEPRLWWDAIERYAEHLSWKNSGNFLRSKEARDEAVDLILTDIQMVHGDAAKQRVQQVLQRSAQ